MADLRETLSEAYDKMSETTATPAPEPAETVSTAPPPAATETRTAVPTAAETATAAEQRARDEKGRFAAKTTATEPSKPGEESATAPKVGAVPEPSKAKAEGTPSPVVPSAEAASPKFKPPQSWKPAIRELAAKLPAEFAPILEEADRRERETTKVLSETAQVRQFAGQVQASLSPYQSIAAANGTDVMTWAGTALQTVAALYAGTPQQKAQVIAQAIATSGIDVEAINQAMQNPQAQPARPVAPQMDPEAAVEKVIQARLQKLEAQRAEQQAAEFVQAAPEFLSDVQTDMVEILRLAEAKGQRMTYQQAYDRACKVNPEVQAILDQRKAADAAKAATASTQRTQAAASSVRGQPAAGPSAQPKTLRDTLNARYDELASQ